MALLDFGESQDGSVYVCVRVCVYRFSSLSLFLIVARAGIAQCVTAGSVLLRLRTKRLLMAFPV